MSYYWKDACSRHARYYFIHFLLFEIPSEQTNWPIWGQKGIFDKYGLNCFGLNRTKGLTNAICMYVIAMMMDFNQTIRHENIIFPFRWHGDFLIALLWICQLRYDHFNFVAIYENFMRTRCTRRVWKLSGGPMEKGTNLEFRNLIVNWWNVWRKMRTAIYRPFRC